ncbi:DNA-binding transcriptional regulator, FadR family [Gracilibacillus orientalis]|uniref:DNA-binding transcriptional regulator, FadR family n=1 Tax=Gracilibacillus orientalis TaxID=334253 RepID=A0A1I4HRH8_9BACI|nr:FCD domain-containing protein [Gracilibacillus orientalis]SFL44360.1 DNA-binding transcriptional regulator, FadR family [Gracilibacillus orientalis]
MKKNAEKKVAQKSEIIDIIVECLSAKKYLPSEKELTERLGVSRPVLRELLSEFEASGIIVPTQGRGREVKFPDVSNSILGGWNILLRARPASLLELLEVRYNLERGFLPSAIEALTLEDLQMMRDLVNRMEAKAQRKQLFKEEDQLFHRILYSRTKNLVLDQLLHAFWELFEQKSELHHSANLAQAAELHHQLYQAILTENTEEAEKLLKLQFHDVRQRIVNMMKSNQN